MVRGGQLRRPESGRRAWAASRPAGGPSSTAQPTLTRVPSAPTCARSVDLWHSVPAVVPLGEVLTVVSTFVNTGEQPLNISFIIGSLNNVQNFAIYYQNTTVSQVGEVVEPGMEVRPEARAQCC